MDPLPTGDEGASTDLAGWLAGVERQLDAMGERITRLESSIRPAVAEEVHGATSELRRAMTELGRRLVQDLPHELARHRDAIVAELRPPPPPPPPPPSSTTPPPPAPAPAELDTEHEDEQGPLAPQPATAAASPDDADAGTRRRTPRRRRRHG